MKLKDHSARAAALTDLNRSLLVEAGAGSGKTALLAGRVVNMLASGVEPSSIAAVTFTEMAAAELMERIDRHANAVAAGDVPIDLQAAFGKKPSPKQKENLERAKERLNQITCTTIHGFCQRLLKPYPVEADIDPGARILDAAEADLVFEETFRDWLKDRLSGDDRDQDIITVLASSENPAKDIEFIREVAETLRRKPGSTVPEAELDRRAMNAFVQAVDEFASWCGSLGYEAEGNREIVDALIAAANSVRTCLTAPECRAAAEIATLGSPVYMKADGGYRAYRFKGKWTAAAPDKKQGEAANNEAAAHYERCTAALAVIRENAAAAGIAMLGREIAPLLERYQKRKRDGAFLDFEDLLVKTRQMLENHPQVAEALGQRFSHILVDEFQDTDPVQTDIFKMLAFEKKGDGAFVPKPGAIFLVGDPKQAIYRFRGADVRTYTETRSLMKACDPNSVIEVTTNFRSRGAILDYVNAVFAEPLSEERGQPGFASLDAFRGDYEGCGPAVSTFSVPEAESSGEARDVEAKAVAEICRDLIGSYPVQENGATVPCSPRHIALLAPAGTELWRYENALEALGISVSTQAGKGMFQQQEVQDLIALTRVLADPRDQLALGALLRGPLVGLTENELLDEVALLEPEEDGSLSFIRVGMDPQRFVNPVLREVMSILNALRSRALDTTPHAILSEAVEVMNVRPNLKLRKSGSSERALANVDRFLEMSRPYSVRGLRYFSDDMRRRWEDSERMVEGRPDSEEESVSLITMHSAKGLEWPVVIPVNSLTETMKPGRIVTNNETLCLSMPFFGVLPSGYAEMRSKASIDDEAERVRLWYVACTRARDLLVLPRHEKVNQRCWANLVDLKLEDVARLDTSAFAGVAAPVRDATSVCLQDAATFVAQTAKIADARRPVLWSQPSRKEYSPMLDDRQSSYEMVLAELEFGYVPEEPAVQGGAERGDVLHKLIEEVLNGETPENEVILQARAAELAEQYRSFKDCPDAVLDPAELAATVIRALRVPEVAAVRPHLVPEVTTFACYEREGGDIVVHGVIDAAERRADGTMGLVVDWKSDVKPNAEAIAHYSEQVRKYLRMNGVSDGLIVFMTPGTAVRVSA